MKIRLFKLLISLLFLLVIVQSFTAIAEYETCPKCNGDGICKFCYGGDPIMCPDCLGSGMVYTGDCDICEGSGYIDGYECPMCSGTGELWEVCNCCEGTGEIVLPGEFDCQYCSGTGICSFCGGDGQVFVPPVKKIIFGDLTPGFEGSIFVFVVIVALVLIHFKKNHDIK